MPDEVMIPVGRVQVATPITMAAAVRQNTVATEAIDERIQNVATAIISADPTITAAAAAAIATELVEKDILQGGDSRIPEDRAPTTLGVEGEVGSRLWRILVDGREFHANQEVVPSNRYQFRIGDKIVFDVNPDTLETIIPGFRPSTFGPAVATRNIMLINAGQSNGDGRAMPISPELDPIDSRILMWDWTSSAFKTATVPLSSSAPSAAAGLGVATVVAREILANEPAGTNVIIVNCAVGGSGLVGDAATGNWGVNYAGTNPRLYLRMVNAIDQALATATTSGRTPDDVRFLWHQGEADNTEAAYASAFDELVSSVRAHLGRPEMTVTLGGIVPEYIKSSPNRANVRAAHIGAQSRLTRTGYADGIPNGGGSGNVSDIVHYSRGGMVALGKAMYQASRRALANTTTSVPVPPGAVEATVRGGQLRVQWTPPFCRFTAFTVEQSADGATWTPIPAGAVPLELSREAAAVNASPWVRVSTSNGAVTSAPSSPIQADGV